MSACGRYVLITVHAGCERNNLLYYADLEKIGYDINSKYNTSRCNNIRSNTGITGNTSDGEDGYGGW